MDMEMDMPGSNGSGDSGHSSEDHHPSNFAIHVSVFLVLQLASLFIAFGVCYPNAFAAKQANRNQRHMFFQIAGAALSVVAFICGHLTGIDGYNSWYSDIAIVYGWVVAGMSLLLLIYMPRGILANIKNAINIAHTTASVVQPLISWVCTGLSVISLLGFCKSDGDHTGQCIAHGIMGTAFITYGILLMCMLYFGQNFLIRVNRSQEFFDSWVITVWGIINTFTEHRWGKDWNHKDVQHTSMGIVWWAVGMFGIYTTWDRVNNKPKRSHIPGFIMILTGYAMMSHSQSLKVSSHVHYMFGVMLILAGLARVIEISFVLNDGAIDTKNAKIWLYVTPLLLIESGCLFMSATEESMAFLTEHGIMAAPYILVITSVAAIVALLAVYPIEQYVLMKKQNELNYKEADEGYEAPFLQEESNNFDVDYDDI